MLYCVVCCVVLVCRVFFGVVWCSGALCRLLVWSAASVCIALVLSGYSTLPPPLLLPLVSGLLLRLVRFFCAVLGCDDVSFCCAACPAMCCCLRCFVLCGAPPSGLSWLVLLPVVSGCLLLGPVVRCHLLEAPLVAVVPAWPRGLVPCCVPSSVVEPCSPVLCPVVPWFALVLCCGGLLSVLLFWWCLFILCPVLGRSAALPYCAACGVSFVAPCAVFCGAFHAALCCAVLARLRCFAVLCIVALIVAVGVLRCCLWFLAVRCRVLLPAVVPLRRAS